MNFVKTTRFFSDPLRDIENRRIFAARSLRMTTLTVNSKLKKGMYGFDSKMNCHVSMPSLAVTLVNLDCKRIIGENNYAFAA